MSPFLKAVNAAGRLLCRLRGTRCMDALERACDRFHRAINNVDFDMRRNGERRVLEIVSESQPTCMFDVGANAGEWARVAAIRNPACTIHAFEIVPTTREKLAASTRECANVVVADHGLSDEAGAVTVHLGDDSRVATACRLEGVASCELQYDRSLECVVMPACDYMRRHGVTVVDFVKIDVEGMDLRVIRGFRECLQHVRALQFEYGVFNIASHDLLADFFRCLTSHGFVVGKVFPRCVRFSEYDVTMENFHGSNYVAVRSDERDLIERLQGMTNSA